MLQQFISDYSNSGLSASLQMPRTLFYLLVLFFLFCVFKFSLVCSLSLSPVIPTADYFNHRLRVAFSVRALLIGVISIPICFVSTSIFFFFFL